MYVLLDQFNIGTIRRIRSLQLHSVLEILIDLNLSLNIEMVQSRI